MEALNKDMLRGILTELRSMKPTLPDQGHQAPVRKIRKISAPMKTETTKAELKNECFAQGISIGRTYRNFESWSNHFPVKFEITKECWIGRIYYIEYKQHIYYADKVLFSSCSFYPDGSMQVKSL